MAKIIGITDVPELPGAGVAEFDDGRPGMLLTPELANEHRERLGLSAMKNGVAGPGSGTPDDGITNLPNAPGAPAQEPANIPNAAPNALASGQMVNASAPNNQPTVDPDGTMGRIAKPLDPTQQAYDANQKSINDSLVSGIVQGGPVVHTPAGFSPDTKKEVHERGPAYDETAAKMRLAAGNAVLDAQLGKMGAESAQWDAQAAQAAKAHEAAVNEAAQAQGAKVLAERRFNEQKAAKEKDLETYTKDGAPNPQHYFEQKGTFVNILSAIAQGLGAAGASLGHTENFALKITQDAIQRDMAAQEQAYNAGIKTRNNALERFLQYTGGDMEEAKSLLHQSMLKVAETETSRLGALAQSNAIKNNAGVVVAQFQQAQLLEEQRQQQIAEGKTTTESTQKYHQASGGGKYLTFEQRLAAAKDAVDAQGGKRQPGASGTTDVDITHMTEAQKAESLKSYGAVRADLVASQQSAQRVAKSYGMKVDFATGQLLGADGKPVDPAKVNIPGVGKLPGLLGAAHRPTSGVGSTQESREAFAARMAMKNDYRKLNTGVAFSPQEDKDAQMVTHGETEADAVADLARTAANLAEKQRTLEASTPPQIAQMYESNLRGAATRRAGTVPPEAGLKPHEVK